MVTFANFLFQNFSTRFMFEEMVNGQQGNLVSYKKPVHVKEITWKVKRPKESRNLF
jgi:hypothetical protein